MQNAVMHIAVHQYLIVKVDVTDLTLEVESLDAASCSLSGFSSMN